jgi:RNA polymerase sigma factor (sigma-70 family)
MATSQMSEFIQQLRRSVPQHGHGPNDEQVLENYISRRDQAAVATLVQRHGPMVWGVCRRILSNYHDAEDAFQATFLVLFRKAASIVRKDLLANWLYGVAHQTALKARATAVKRCARERQVAEMPEPGGEETDLWLHIRPVLDQELSRLPGRYRSVIVLCDLEGKTRKDAALQLGVPEGTVASRMATAKKMLAKRLARHAPLVSGGMLVAVLTETVASASVPISVMSTTVKSARQFAAGQVATTATISGEVVALTEGVLKSMLLTKLKAITGLFVVAAVCAATGLVYRTHAAEQTQAQEREKEKPPAFTRNEDKSDKDNQATIAARKDYQELQGVWQAVAVAIEGKPAAEVSFAHQVWVFDGNRIRGSAPFLTYTLSAFETPKAISLTYRSRKSNTEYGPVVTDLGIYEIKGDNLTIALRKHEYGRPKEFQSTAENHTIVRVFKRVRLGQDLDERFYDAIGK